MKATATSVAECQKDCGLDTTVEEYVASLHPGLMEVVYEWARGMPFKDVMNLTDVSEGLFYLFTFLQISKSFFLKKIPSGSSCSHHVFIQLFTMTAILLWQLSIPKWSLRENFVII